MQEQQAALAADGIKVVIVDLGENAGRVRSYLQSRGMSFQVFLDEESMVADEYGVMGIPTFCLVDREGIVRSVGHELPEDYQTLLAAAPKS